MKVLVACEYSGTVRDAFIKLGHDAMSCDLLPTDVPGQHYQGDVREILDNDWDLIIAHPTCTYLANSGVCHLHKDESRWDKLYEAAEFFKLFLNHSCEKICIENGMPLPHIGPLRIFPNETGSRTMITRRSLVASSPPSSVLANSFSNFCVD